MKQAPPRVPWITALLILLVSCGAGKEEGQEPYTTKTYLEVESRFPTEFAIGPETVPLTQFQSIAVDPARRIFIGQPMSGHVLVLVEGGTAARIVGRRGDGPGEFRNVHRLGLTGDGVLWVFDPTARRITFVDQDGAVVSTRRVPDAPSGSPSSLEVRAVFDDRGLLLMDRNVVGPPGSVRDSLSVYGLLSGDGELKLLARSSFRGRTMALFGDAGSGAIVSRQPVTYATVVGPSSQVPGAVLVPPGPPEGDSVRIIQITLHGDTVKEVAYERTPIPVSDSLRRDRTNHLMERAIESELFGSRSEARIAVSEALVLPPFWPAAQEVVPSERSDEIWLRVGQDREGREMYERVRLSRTGELSRIERLVAPPGVRILWGRDDPLGRYTDEWGQHIMVRLRAHGAG